MSTISTNIKQNSSPTPVSSPISNIPTNAGIKTISPASSVPNKIPSATQAPVEKISDPPFRSSPIGTSNPIIIAPVYASIAQPTATTSGAPFLMTPLAAPLTIAPIATSPAISSAPIQTIVPISPETAPTVIVTPILATSTAPILSLTVPIPIQLTTVLQPMRDYYGTDCLPQIVHRSLTYQLYRINDHSTMEEDADIHQTWLAWCNYCTINRICGRRPSTLPTFTHSVEIGRASCRERV